MHFLKHWPRQGPTTLQCEAGLHLWMVLRVGQIARQPIQGEPAAGGLHNIDNFTGLSMFDSKGDCDVSMYR